MAARKSQSVCPYRTVAQKRLLHFPSTILSSGGNRGVELLFVAQMGNGIPIDQMTEEKGTLLLRRVMLAFVAHESFPL